MTYRYAKPAILSRIPTDRSTAIEASAGTGKTFTLEHLVVELLLVRKATIDEILVVTFTEKATREMRQRIREKIESILHPVSNDANRNPLEGEAWTIDEPARRRLRAALLRFDRAPISTIHGFCQRVLTEHAFESGGLFGQELVDVRTAFGAALREELRRALTRKDPLFEAVDAVLEGMSVDVLEGHLFEWFREPGLFRRDLTIDAGPVVRLIEELLPRVRARLEQRKRREGELDYDDIVRRLYEAVHRPGGERLIAALRGAHRFALVDEFQDTDAVQWGIFRKVFFESSDGHVLFVIGDPKQAIYSFRGADVHTYLAARTAIREKGELVSLLDNYRSTPRVIAAYNRILEAGFFEGEIGYLPVRAGDPNKRAVDADGNDLSPVELLHFVSPTPLAIGPIRDTLFEFVATEITHLVEEKTLRYGPSGSERPIDYSDVHILSRTGFEALQAAEALRRHGIPYAFFRQEGLFQTEEALDIRDLLRAIDDPTDRSCRLRAWLTPFFGLPLGSLGEVREVDESHPLVARLHAWHALANDHDYATLFRAVVEESGLVRRELFLERSERRLTNYLHIFEILLERTHRTRATLGELTSELSAYIERRATPPGENGNIQRLESERKAVQILTMHKAKGLEAAVVFVVGGFTRGNDDRTRPQIVHSNGEREAWLAPLPPAVARAVDRECREEDERLLYVALTRAKARLYLPYFGRAPKSEPADGLRTTYGHLRGCYRQLNARLEQLVGEDVIEAEDSLFGYRRLVARARVDAATVTAPSEPTSWQVPESMLRVEVDLETKLEPLRARHAGFVVTSYTRLKAGAYQAEELADEEFTGEALDLHPAEEAKGLPGGTGTGIFLHEVLEKADFRSVRETADADRWGARPEIAELFRAVAQSNGFPLRLLPEAVRLVHATLATEVSLGALRLGKGFCELERTLAEMSFFFPIPERHHPRLDAPRPGPDGYPFEIDRGVIRGVVDLVFEHEGRVYFLDWKSDRLVDFEAQALARHVERNYAVQAKLYTLGIVRMFDLRSEAEYAERFGGLIYSFLRGAERDGAPAYHYELPRFADVMAFEEELRTSDSLFARGDRRGGR